MGLGRSMMPQHHLRVCPFLERAVQAGLWPAVEEARPQQVLQEEGALSVADLEVWKVPVPLLAAV